MTRRRGASRLAAAGLMIVSALSAILGAAAIGARAEAETVTSIPISTFMSAGIGERVQGLVWRGGIEMKSQTDTFGGLSGLGFTGPDNKLVMVSDRGNFVTGQLLYDENARPVGLIGVRIEPIQNSKGDELPRAYTRDAEALTVIFRDGRPSAVRVGFENLTRVADFALVDGRPQGPAREVSIPRWLSDTRTNETLEAVCIAPEASPIAGSTLLLTEGVIDDDGLHSAYLLGRNDKGPLGYVSGSGTNPTDCAFMANGDLLVLERGIALLAFQMRLVRIPAAEVKAGAHMKGELLLHAAGGDIDNMEALAVHTAPDGSTRITIVSDNNFNDWERNLLLEFSLPE
ncbi:esterase-like activity of phytase family protein [Devosia sp. ZB163]|uniref:esterase-like activity of phytase family protein n=1 Tax=Devosia sp. ZB163 TaxID=3025938 RepID=UPI00235E9A96|nr:esterase-like activity of phytase family protein [Devosia sp. ZB163]MDC9826520.1 esterase-like activity of phytase family protein [Devosia sp. ZB163]